MRGRHPLTRYLSTCAPRREAARGGARRRGGPGGSAGHEPCDARDKEALIKKYRYALEPGAAEARKAEAKAKAEAETKAEAEAAERRRWGVCKCKELLAAKQ